MTGATLRLYRQISLPQRLLVLAALAYAAAFLGVVTARPGLGVGDGFYIPIILVGLAGNALEGVGAGILAGLLYAFGLRLADGGTAAVLSVRDAVHLAVYTAVGLLVGYFAARARQMMGDALHALDDLLQLARRDAGTGVLSARGLDGVLAERIERRAPFTLLIGEIDCRRDDACLRRVSGVLLEELGPEVEIARVGPAQLMAVTSPGGTGGARAVAGALERAAEQAGVRATFGWTAYPAEGTDAWSLFLTASERLYSRRIVRGEWTPTPASAGLVDDLFAADA